MTASIDPSAGSRRAVDEDLLDAVRRHLESLQSARFIRSLSRAESNEYEHLLQLEAYLLGRRARDGVDNGPLQNVRHLATARQSSRHSDLRR